MKTDKVNHPDNCTCHHCMIAIIKDFEKRIKKLEADIDNLSSIED